MKNFLIAMLLLLSFGSGISHAHTCVSEIPKLTFVYLSEVNFSHDEGDYVEFYINKPQNIEKELLSIELDGKNIYDGFELSEFNIIEKDLVGTTEQIFVKYGDQVIDAVCWKNDSVSSSEVEEVDLFESLDFGKCNNSNEIDKNLHLAKENLILSKWSLTVSNTPGEDNNFDKAAPKAVIEVQSGETIGVGSITINLDGRKSSDESNLELSYLWDFGGTGESLKANPDSVTFSQAGSYVIELVVENELGQIDEDYLFVTVLPDNLDQETEEKTETPEVEEEVISKVDLTIVDFMANPEGSDSGNEWIDVKNNGESGYAINWHLDDSEGQSSAYDLSLIFFEANETIKISNSESGIGLNNSNDSVRLLKDDNLIHERTYEIAESGVSYIEFEMGKEDDEGSADGYEVSDYIRINELLPNPEGNDSGKEWVEIYNYDEVSTNLAGWYLMVNTKKIILDDYEIRANQYLAIEVSGFSNSGGSVVLYDPNNTLISSTDYEKAIEGQSYSIVQGEWIWSENITKGLANFEIQKMEGNVEDINSIEQVITISSISLLYDELPSAVEVGGHVSFSFVENELLSIETKESEDITLGGLNYEYGTPDIEQDNQMWPYIVIYGLAGILAVYFRKPLFSFVKTKLAEI